MVGRGIKTTYSWIRSEERYSFVCECECSGWGRYWSYSTFWSKIKLTLANFFIFCGNWTSCIMLHNSPIKCMIVVLNWFFSWTSANLYLCRHIESLYRNLNCLHKHDSYRHVYIQCIWNMKIYVYIHIDSLYESVYIMYIYNVYEIWKSMYIYI